jgi:hypothetical protein
VRGGVGRDAGPEKEAHPLLGARHPSLRQAGGGAGAAAARPAQSSANARTLKHISSLISENWTVHTSLLTGHLAHRATCVVYSLNFQSCRHMGHWCCVCWVPNHFMMQWMWKQWLHWPHTCNRALHCTVLLVQPLHCAGLRPAGSRLQRTCNLDSSRQKRPWTERLILLVEAVQLTCRCHTCHR